MYSIIIMMCVACAAAREALSSETAHATYNEALSLQALAARDGGTPVAPLSLLVGWHFSHTLSVPCGDAPAAGLFPLPWLDLLRDFNVTALRASITRGMLPAASWHAAAASPTGAPGGALLELTLGTPQGGEAEGALWQRWDRTVRRAIAVTGASLAGSSTLAPGAARGGAPFPGGVKRDWFTHEVAATTPGGGRTLRLQVPRAALCSDALWGVARLTPCRAHAGIGAALSTRTVVSGAWYSIAWHATRECNSTACGYRVDTAVHTVVTPPLTPQVLEGSGSSGVTLQELLGVSDWGGAGVSGINASGVVTRDAACPLAATSSVHVRSRNTGALLRTVPLRLAAGERVSQLMMEEGRGEGTCPDAPPLTQCVRATRSFTEASLGAGTVRLTLLNACDDGATLRGVMLVTEVIPFMLSRVRGSLLLTTHEGRVQPLPEPEPSPPSLATAQLRGGPAVSRFCVPLLPPPGRVLHAEWQYVAAPFGAGLHAEEFPPDAHRGIELPAAHVRVCAWGGTGADGDDGGEGAAAAACRACADAREGGAATVHDAWAVVLTGGGTIELPAPDFSMPFNVMTLVGTAAAFATGALVNATGRKKGKGRGRKVVTPTTPPRRC